MEGVVAVIPTGSSGREEPERLRGGKITPPKTVRAAGRRKAAGKSQLVTQEDICALSGENSALASENVVPSLRGGLKLKVSPKLLDFDMEGTFRPPFASLCGSCADLRCIACSGTPS